MRLILVTGANGFLGRHLCQYLADRGYLVRALVRNPEQSIDLNSICKGGVYRCALPSDIDARAFDDNPDTVVHAAYTTKPLAPALARAVNVDGSKALLALTRQSGARFCFVSSLSARPDAVSLYGKTKYEIEQQLDPSRDAALRFGQIIGRGGMFDRMRRMVKQSRFVPLFYGGRSILQTLHVTDACAAIERVIDGHLTGVFRVAEPEGPTLRHVLERLAEQEGVRCRFVPLPAMPVYGLLWVAERLGLRLPLTTGNLAGLRQLERIDVSDDLRRLELAPRSFEDSIGPGG